MSPPASEMRRTAHLQGDYRYSLGRDWTVTPTPRRVLWIMLNPSTADGLVDDPTIRRCMGFARSWQQHGLPFTGMEVVNLFGLRATDPRALAVHHDPIGPDNDSVLRSLANQPATTLIVAAWGANSSAAARGSKIRAVLQEVDHQRVHVLGLTKDGHPRHPLYLKASTSPVLWER